MIYFETFLDVTALYLVRECENNIAMVNDLWKLAKGLEGEPELSEAIGRQDEVDRTDIIRRAIFGHKGAPSGSPTGAADAIQINDAAMRGALA